MPTQSDFRLVTRAGCHLCMDMEARLEMFADDNSFEFAVVDVDKDASLLKRFSIDVPVLLKDDAVICKHFFDEHAVKLALQ